MKNFCISGFLLAFSGICLSASGAGNGKHPKIIQPARYQSVAVRQLEVAKMEAKSKIALPSTNQILPSVARKAPKGNSTTAISYVDLGTSINPYGSFLNGRNYVAANPSLNTVALFRRGWQTDPNADGGNNGNKLFYDISVGGGAEGSWQKSQGPVYTHTIYDTTSDNHGARYPQGVIYNPTGNTNPQNAIALGNPRVLDGTNDAWGGLGLGWKTVGPSLPRKQKLWSTEEILHFRTESMEVTSLGHVFLVEPEEDLSGGITFTDKVHVYRYTYNSATNNFDSLVVPIPFSNEGGDFETQIGGTAIAFAPDGLNGFVVISAFNIEFDSVGAYVPFISKTTDGGVTWSNFKLIPLNFPYQNYPSPGLDCLRELLFVSNFVRFTGEGEIVPAQRGEEYAHKVDYIVNDFDLTVDAFGFAHIFTNVSVSGFGDTLASDPASITYYPGYGSWNIDLVIKDLTDEARGYVVSTNSALNGLYGDPSSTADQLIEGNRPQVTRSADGNVIAFCWFDTDQDAHPQTGSNNNSNPDLWVQRVKVTGPGTMIRNVSRNMTKESDYDGLAIQGSVAPQMLNTAQGYKIAATIVNLPPYPGTSAVWPTTHVFVNNLDVPSANDSFSLAVAFCYPVVSTQKNVQPLKHSGKIQVMPNPSQGQVFFQFQSALAGEAKIELVDYVGRTVIRKRVNVEKGNNKYDLHFEEQNAGLFQLLIQLPDGNRLTQKVLKN